MEASTSPAGECTLNLEWGHHHRHPSMIPPRPSESSSRKRMAREGAKLTTPSSGTHIHLGFASGLRGTLEKTFLPEPMDPGYPWQQSLPPRLTYIMCLAPTSLTKAGSQGAGLPCQLSLPTLLSSQAYILVAPNLTALPATPPLPGLLTHLQSPCPHHWSLSSQPQGQEAAVPAPSFRP